MLPIGELCEKHNLVYMVDNTMTPAYIFDAKAVKASLLVGSLTKYMAGHGQVLGGVVVDTGLYSWALFYEYGKNKQSMMDAYRAAVS